MSQTLEIKQTKLSCGCIIESKHPPVVERIKLCNEHSTQLMNQVIKLFAEKLVNRVKLSKVLLSIQSADWIVEEQKGKVESNER